MKTKRIAYQMIWTAIVLCSVIAVYGKYHYLLPWHKVTNDQVIIAPVPIPPAMPSSQANIEMLLSKEELFYRNHPKGCTYAVMGILGFQIVLDQPAGRACSRSSD